MRWKLGRRDAQGDLFRPDNVLRGHVGEDSFYGLLAQHGGEWYSDDSFSTIYHAGVGRPSVSPSQLCVAMLLQFHDRVCHEEAINQRVHWCRARRSWPIGERVSDILVGDGGCVRSDPKGRDVVCVAGFRMSETTARVGGQGAAYAAASHLGERAGDSEYLIVNRQSRTHVRTIARSHQVPVDWSEERPIRTHDQQGVG